MTATDPRPLIGEPVSLDLLNTRWMHEGVRQDLLTGVDELAIWLRSVGLDGRFTADEATLTHLLTARDALDGLVDSPGDAHAAARLDAVLDHGRIRATLTADGPGERPEFTDPAWGAAWTAARDYLDLLRTAPDRIRGCAHESCILHFFDTSRNGTRRWCSMAGCGNRAKASRHYARSRDN
ncbi:CGNR zinc finger domain-containing protein [Streptomyces beijiangensis]|uniref:CGNR zinc finger domain-containing protein n=1 Tax=Streptomyces beijiangensis TaxID=163361 RepID=A0A939FBT3_9ACTN|nr:CGNR zinc finger domain-containing protein [Streptomyces beijiangensis]MBO0515259.1 CGNR zinc finger domain-containing protein [Streptomyces beijiangensis]